MKRIISTLIISLVLVSFKAGASAGDNTPSLTEATVASPLFDPKNKDCNCLGNKNNQKASDNRAKDVETAALLSDVHGKAVPVLNTNTETVD